MKTTLAALLLCAGVCLRAQAPLDIAREYVRTHRNEWNLQPEDLDGMTVKDQYTDPATGITRVYFLQHYRGIPVYNAILNVSIARTGDVFFAGSRFIPDLAGKVNATAPVLSAADAVARLATRLGLPAGALRLQKQTEGAPFVFEKGGIATEDIPVLLSYQPSEDRVRLAWDILLAPVGRDDKWSTRVDAVDGTVLHEYNWTSYCGPVRAEEPPAPTESFESLPSLFLPHLPPSGAGSYRVWPAPYASPNHGPRTAVTDPADPVASPYGWHDTNGQPGAESTTTRGNNAHAFQDRDGNGLSSNDEPGGGLGLQFNFPFDPALEPKYNVDAAVVNLFYWVNYMHDFTYRFGFDEVAGNFQKNNYGKGGFGNDFFKVRAQAAANNGLRNQAFYSHGNDGTSGTISMREFDSMKKYLTVLEPAAVAGRYLTILPKPGWGAGAYLGWTPVVGEVILADDGVENSLRSDGCEELLNAAELAGNIAFFDRGACDISSKVLRAQKAGAIGAIICNYEEAEINVQMSAGQGADSVKIPTVLVNAWDGQTIRRYIGNGLNVRLVNAGQDTPPLLDSGLDNIVVAHEFGHGVSNRLVGGPGTICLENAEEMGEGWSDFIAFAVTAQPGDSGVLKKGFATYVTEDPNTGRGWRRYPYSTDMAVNPLTYGAMAPAQEVHDLGEIWGAVLWDMYWALAKKYGWRADPHDPSGGNHKAIRLVIEGMKNTPCSPGFVDARNAILAADQALYNGENTCLLWEVFARRGLGYSADQGSPFDAGDQREAFDVPPLCSNRLQIEKSVTDFIQPGKEIEVEIKVGNFKPQTASEVAVKDEIPPGTTYKPNSANRPATVQGNIISFQLGDLAFGQEATIRYTLNSSSGAWSKRKFLDPVPDQSGAYWLAYDMGSIAPNGWSVTDDFPAHSGSFAWHCGETVDTSRQGLELNADVYSFHVEGARPALRFYHRYQTAGGVNGGLVEVKEKDSDTWQQVGGHMIRNGYPGFIAYKTFIRADLQAFSGQSDTAFRATYVDLSEWAGKNIHVRFRFGTDTSTHKGFGWLLDDIEFMDLLGYDGQACATSASGDYACARAPEGATIVDSRSDPLGAEEPFGMFSSRIYPNPVRDKLTVVLQSDRPRAVDIRFFTADGRQLIERSLQVSETSHYSIDTGRMPAGVYFLKVASDAGSAMEKIVVQR